MSRIKKILPVLWAGVLIVSMFTSCAGGEKPDEQQSGKGKAPQSITVLVETGSPTQEVVEALKADFIQNTGIEVVVEAMERKEMDTTIAKEVKSGEIVHDIICTDSGGLVTFKEGLTVLTDAASDEVKQYSLPNVLQNATVAGDVLGYPLWTDCQIVTYRTDLFEDETNQADFASENGYPLAPPETWKEFYKVAKFFAGKGMYGTALQGVGKDSSAQFLNLALQAGARPLVLEEDMVSVNVNTEPYINSLKFIQKMATEELLPPDTALLDAEECNQMFIAGEIPMQLNWGRFYPEAYQELGEKVGVSTNLKGTGGLGAASVSEYMCVMKKSLHQDEALDFLECVFENNNAFLDTGLKLSGRTFEQDAYREQPEYAHLTMIYKTLRGTMSQPVANIEEWNSLEAVLSDTVKEVLAGSDPVEEAEKAQSRMNAIMGGL